MATPEIRTMRTPPDVTAFASFGFRGLPCSLYCQLCRLVVSSHPAGISSNRRCDFWLSNYFEFVYNTHGRDARVTSRVPFGGCRPSQFSHAPRVAAHG